MNPIEPSTRRIVAGLDGGGTKTVCVIAEGDRIVGVGVGGPANVCTHPATARESVAAAWKAARAEAGIDSPMEAVCIGVAGFFACTAPEGPEGLLQSVVPARRTRIVSDMETSFLGATLGKPGVVLIAGTGSVAYGGNSQGERARASGWGYLLADEGSAFWIGWQAARAALQDYDGRGRPTGITAALLDHLGLPDPPAIEGYVYNQPQLSTRLAALAPLVVAVAHAGDPVALNILHEAGRHLAGMAVTVLRRLDLLTIPAAVVPVGGVLRDHDGPVFLALKAALADQAKAATIAPAPLPPVGGALFQAWLDASSSEDAGRGDKLPAATCQEMIAAWASDLSHCDLG